MSGEKARQVPGSRAVNKKGPVKIQRLQAQTRNIEKVASSEDEIRKEKPGRKRRPDKQQATGRSVKSQRCQEQAGSRESDIIRQDAEKKEM